MIDLNRSRKHMNLKWTRFLVVPLSCVKVVVATRKASSRLGVLSFSPSPCAFCIFKCCLLFEFQSFFFFSFYGSLAGCFSFIYLFVCLYINIIFQKSSYESRPTTLGPKSLKLLYSTMKSKLYPCVQKNCQMLVVGMVHTTRYYTHNIGS
jgi:hypothetical protein